MKRCPECRRDYFDDSLQYCLDDGSALLEGPGSIEPATAILSDPNITGDTATRTFGDIASATAPESKRNPVILAAVGIMVVAVLAVGAYLYFGRPETEINSIAVMPFVNESGNPEIEYLSDGMTDTLINNLSRIPKLSVKARSSVFRFKGKDIEPQKIAADLNVQAVVNGRVMQRGENLTLNLEVVDARTGDQIWGEQYVRKIGDLISLQSDIARDVSGKLRQKLNRADTDRISKRGTENTEAYQQYLKGRFYWNKRTIEDINKSIDYFQKAIELDPSYALAYAGLADSYVIVPSYSNNRAKEFYPKARSAAMKALEIDDSLAQAHATLGGVLHEFDWKFEEAEKEFKRAIELDPNYATAHHYYSEFLLSMGRFDEAVAEIKRAQECDPLSLIINSVAGIANVLHGDFEEAEAQLKRTIEMDPNFPRAHLFLGQIYEDRGRIEEAIDEYEKHAVLSGTPADFATKASEAIRQAYRKNGMKGYNEAVLEMTKKSLETDPETSPPLFVVATLYARVGDKERALEYLEKSFDQREPDILQINEPQPALESLRSEPRFKDIVRRIGVPQR
jgi:TolB-like protein/tetratricopeptide (TPR) repeat protein